MKSQYSNSNSQIAVLKRLDAIAEEFEDSWRSGETPDIERFVDQFESEIPRNLLVDELVEIEIELRSTHGDVPLSSDEYINRFPDLDRRSVDRLIEKAESKHQQFSIDSVDKSMEETGEFISQKATGESQIDKLCHQFNDQWSRGERPSISEYIVRVPEKLRSEFLLLLISMEVRQRRDIGEEPTIGEYAQQFEISENLVKAVFTEGGKPQMREYRFPFKIHNYEVLDQIGRGGMGDVLLARHQRFTNRKYAIKLLRRSIFCADSVNRFQREIDAIANLDHENLVFANDAGIYNEEPYLVMEYIDGIDGQSLVAQHKPLSIQECCAIVELGLCGLQHAHSKGLVHRDVKPSNLMISKDGVVKLLDMGLAKIVVEESDTAFTKDGRLLGTPSYMAPEQWEKPTEVDIRADIYSFGCTLFNLIAGKTPYAYLSTDSVMGQMCAHLLRPPQSIRKLRPETPKELERIINKALSKKPADRFKTPGEFQEALSQFSEGADLTRFFDGQVKADDQETRKSRRVPNLDATTSDVASPLDLVSSVDSLSSRSISKFVMPVALLLLIAVSVVALLVSQPWNSIADNTDNPEVPIPIEPEVFAADWQIEKLIEEQVGPRSLGPLGSSEDTWNLENGDWVRGSLDMNQDADFMALAFTPSSGRNRVQLVTDHRAGKEKTVKQFQVPEDNKFTLNDGTYGQYALVVLMSPSGIQNSETVFGKIRKEAPWFVKDEYGLWIYDGKKIKLQTEDTPRGVEEFDSGNFSTLIDWLTNEFPQFEIRGVAFPVAAGNG